MSLGMSEIILILLAVLVLFGGKKIPELARALGKAQAEYKKARESTLDLLNEFENEKYAAKEGKPAAKRTRKTAAKKTTAAKRAVKTTKTTRKKSAAEKSANPAGRGRKKKAE